ncbi:MAG TPA: hypothetical protein VFO17_08795 [Acidimicrobiia bacterium]|jgi:hypothetical protein|nr:hypothetical protein [Acidimicrobiia bacterium]
MNVEKLVAIYLNDHWAGAGAGKALAKRVEGHNRGTEWGPILAEVATQIAEDERTLRELRERLGVGGGAAKRFLAVAGERVSRLKLNGRLVGFSPLSRLLEIEALICGVAGKKCLWSALRAIPGSTDLSDFELERLEQRAIEQMEILMSAHEKAASDLVPDSLASAR